MKVLVLNAGSSSVKYELIDLAAPRSVLDGSVDVTGSGGGRYADAFAAITAALESAGVSGDALDVIGHRVVHGGDAFVAPTRISDPVLAQIESLNALAPLHNPASLAGILAAREQFPVTPQVAVFDTAFHSTMPDRARHYAIDTTVAREQGIRRYGFHGTSYAYVTRRAAQLLGQDVESTNLIALHLGNGTSACAIESGRSVDTSMGFTPLEGLVMGTRSGDIDPGVVFHLVRHGDLSIEQVDELLNTRSGLEGLCGASDMRAVIAREDPRARAAVELFCYRICKYVGAYTAVLPRVDALVFTAGIGEHRAEIREAVCKAVAHLGFEIDTARNRAPSNEDRFVETDRSAARILVVRTQEALEIARQSARLVSA